MGLPALILIAVAAVVSGLGGFLLRGTLGRRRMADAERRAADLAREAELLRKTIELEGRESIQRVREEFERETRTERARLEGLDRSMADQERRIQAQSRAQEERERDLLAREDRLAQTEEAARGRLREVEHRMHEANRRLESVAGLSVEVARGQILRQAEEEGRIAAARVAAHIRESAVREAERDARRLIGLAIQRLASDQTMESTVVAVHLPSDDMKGRIIGREGRNIRAFETATGVDVIIDDTPEAVLLSSFDPMRRELAKRSLEQLIEDGRIHPGRIEEIVRRVEGELRSETSARAEEAALEAGVTGLPPEIIDLLGQLAFRTSFGQNVLQHSVEVAQLSGLLAAELRLDPSLARRAGLVHDLGKAIDQHQNGSHAAAGAELLRRCGERAEIVDAVGAHHAETETSSAYAWILQGADAISGSRPGARREKLETYLKRLEHLETIANSFSGVERAYAIQAGRELRILVHGKDVSDGDAAALAAGVAGRVEKELQYPGQIKVVVIRETRAVEYAR